MTEGRPQAGWAEEHVRQHLTSALERAARQTPGDVGVPAKLDNGGSKPAAVAGNTSAAPVPARQPRPITFNAAMVRAILAGNKTQTRRPIRPIPSAIVQGERGPWPASEMGEPIECRLASPGEILWVREPWAHAGTSRGRPRLEFEADFGPAAAREKAPWRAGRFLPRELSRLELEVRSVRPQRLTNLKPQDAIAEGVSPVLFEEHPAGAVEQFRKMWDAFYGLTDFAWENNPWVWVVRFKSVEPKEDE